jgi:hypothetical protein
MMDKVKRPRGLIRLDSERGLAGEKRRYWRPRLFVYVGLGLLGLGVMSFTLRQRLDFEANLIRLQGEPWVIEDGMVRNSFELHIVNKRNDAATYRIVPDQVADVTWTIPLSTVRLDSLGSVDAPLFVSMPAATVHGDHPLHLRVLREGGDPNGAKQITVPFLAPQNAQ